MLFADDATIFFTHQNLAEIYRCIKNELKIIQNWFQVNGLLIMQIKHNMYYFTIKGNIREGWDLSIGEAFLKRENVVNFLGDIIEENLKRRDHTDKVILKVCS